MLVYQFLSIFDSTKKLMLAAIAFLKRKMSKKNYIGFEVFYIDTVVLLSGSMFDSSSSFDLAFSS